MVVSDRPDQLYNVDNNPVIGLFLFHNINFFLLTVAPLNTTQVWQKKYKS